MKLCPYLKTFISSSKCSSFVEKRGGEKELKREKIFLHEMLLVGLRSFEIFMNLKMLTYKSKEYSTVLLEEKGEHLPTL